MIFLCTKVATVTTLYHMALPSVSYNVLTQHLFIDTNLAHTSVTELFSNSVESKPAAERVRGRGG